MLFSAAFLKNKDGEAQEIVGIARDITQRRQAEEALRQSERELHYLSSQLFTVQEKERRRLSLELHDELGQALMVLKLKVRAIQNDLGNKNTDMAQQECLEITEYINEVTENVRRLSRDLSPSILEDLGLSVAIRKLVETSVQHCKIDIALDIIDLDNLFGPDGEITIYRIIQECLTNIAKHSGASRVNISATREDNQILVAVADNGHGFDLQETLDLDANKRGLGLSAMYERARMLGGSLQINSEKGKGTNTTFTVPINNITIQES